MLVFVVCDCDVLYFLIIIFFFNDTATTEIYTYYTLFPYTTLFRSVFPIASRTLTDGDRTITVPEQMQRMTVLLHREMPETFSEWKKAIGMRSEEHTSELQSLMRI